MCETARKSLGRVYISLSRCIYQNLAYEEYLFRHHDIDKDGDTMIVWSNRPTVVIGRHQNPWVEANLPYIRQQGIDLARRHSGGGTVYHDLGNLNVSLLTSQKSHCRPRNLRHLSAALNDNFTLNVVPSKRDDMELQPGSRKCSGTAARIARGKAYHHMTLLVQADLERLSRALRSPIRDRVHSNASASVRAPAVGFLKQDDPSVDVEKVQKVVIDHFSEQFEVCSVEVVDIQSEMMEKDEIVTNYSLLREWDWVFGKTPKFTVEADGRRQFVEGGIVKECSLGNIGSRFDM